MEKRFLIAATAGLLGGFCLSHLRTLDGRLEELELGGRVPESELGHVQMLLARMELRVGDLQAELEASERELSRWREHTAESVARTVEARLTAADQGSRERWTLLESELTEAARLTREHEDRLQALTAQPSDESLWRDLMAPTVQLAGSGTVGTGVLLASEPVDAETWRTPVLTAWHVVRDILAEASPDERRVPVRLYEPDGTSRVESARLLRYDPALDVALLELETSLRVDRGARLASRARLESMRTFDAVYAVGCPLGNDPIPTRGALADPHHQVDGGRYWMISAPTYIGNSGGGIFDARTHELVGIFSKIYTHGTLRPTVVPHMGLATPLQDVYDWLDSEGLAGLEPAEPEPIANGAPGTVPAGVAVMAETESPRPGDEFNGH